MLELWKDFLLYNKGERRSIITLCMLLVLSTIFFVLIPYLFRPKISPLKITELKIENEKSSVANDFNEVTHDKKTYIQPDIHVTESFDPNLVSDATLSSFGLPPKLVKTWINYTSKGGKFRVKEDLQKLYGMTTEVYNALSAYINIPEKSSYTKEIKSTQNYVFEKKALHINLNTADTTELKRLPMIGSGRAKKIILYRNILGGFIQVSQLKEVYGFHDSIYDVIKDLVFVESGYIPNKVFINKMDNKEMARQPYFRTIANLIVNYRKEHGAFKNEKELRKIMALEEATISRIGPYINFDTD